MVSCLAQRQELCSRSTAAWATAPETSPDLLGPAGIVLRLISLSLLARLSAVQANVSHSPGLSMTHSSLSLTPFLPLPLLRETLAPEHVGGQR